MNAIHTSFLLSVATLYTMLAISPGPNFLVITQAAISRSRTQALCIALGVSTASVIWAMLAVLGLGIFLKPFPWAQNTLQILGGFYLFYVGAKMLINARNPLNQAKELTPYETHFKAYFTGVLTNLTNPKTLMFFSSIFAGLFSHDLNMQVKLLAIALVASISVIWNVLTVTLFSLSRVRLIYTQCKPWLDMFFGIFIVYFGFKLMIGS